MLYNPDYKPGSPQNEEKISATRWGLLKGGLLLSSGQMMGYALSFLRNLILARLLTKSDFGLAAALWVAVSLLELVNRMGFRNQIIQAKEGDMPRFQETAHAVQSIVGIISALMIVACAYPMALTFGVPDLAWAFACVGLVPLARGLMHLDIARFQRKLDFSPGVLAELIPQVMATAVAWPLAIWLRDFRAVLLIMIGKELMTLVMSHFMSSRPYRWAWERNYIKEMLSFGWPLLLTGFVMFASQQGDQMIVGSALSLADLGSYSIAFELSSVPFYIFGAVFSSLFLPTLARHQDYQVEFQRLYRKGLELCVVGSLVLLGPLLLAGDTIVRILYGPKYSGVGTLMAVFGAVVALRFFRLAPAIASMSRADTVNQFISNVARSASLPLAILLVGVGTRDMAAVAACGLVGEGLAILVSVVRAKRRQGIEIAVHLKPTLFLGGWLALGAVIQRNFKNGTSIWLELAGVAGMWVFGIGTAIALFPELSSIFRQGIDEVRLRFSSATRSPR